MMLLALDQASGTTGYAVFDDKTLVTSGTFTTTSNHPLGKKLVFIINKIKELIDQYNIDEVIFEDIQMQKQTNNVRTYKVLAEVIGAIEKFLTENKIKYEIVTSSVWRSQLNIKGSVRDVYKKAAQNYVLDHYGKTATEDESDAICIGAYKTKYGEDSGFNWDS